MFEDLSINIDYPLPISTSNSAILSDVIPTIRKTITRGAGRTCDSLTTVTASTSISPASYIVSGEDRQALLDRVSKNFEEGFAASNFPGWSITVPQQDNSSDCGVFLLHYLEMFSRKPFLNRDRLVCFSKIYITLYYV